MLETSRMVMQHAQAAARTVEGQALIVLTRSGEVLVLNASGTWLWELLAEAQTVGALAAQLAAQFHLGWSQAMADVQTFVASLLEVGAVAWVEAP